MDDDRDPAGGAVPGMSAAPAIFLVFLRLGLTAFGGPVAHLGYFRDEFVRRRRWIGEQDYAALVALCQMLPGPTSSQVGMAIGMGRGGAAGALAAFLGFTLPSAVAMVVFALGIAAAAGPAAGWLHGLKVAAVAVVAHALWSMAAALAPDRLRATVAVAAAALAAVLPPSLGQLAAIATGAGAGWLLLPGGTAVPAGHVRVPLSRAAGAGLLAAFGILLAGLPWLAAVAGSPALDLFAACYRAGALVFGGGHVVLPLLHAQAVAPGWVTHDAFVAGYGAAQALPGPLFAFAAYLGALASHGPGGWLGAATALAGIFLPGFLLAAGALPLWSGLRRHAAAGRTVAGVNAAVVGLLLAAFHDPVWTSAIHSGLDFCLACAAFVLLACWRLPAWLVVPLAALAGALAS
jgi:chromate transporter